MLDMHNIDVKVENEDASLILSASLPNSYENFFQSLIGSKDTMSLEEVGSALQSRELHHKTSCSGTDDQALGYLLMVERNLRKIRGWKTKS